MIQECETWLFGNDYGAISGNTNLLATFTRLINYGCDEVLTDILGADGKWQYDDTNYTEYPIGTTTMVDNQQDYTLDSTQIKVIGVELEDSAGNWRKLKQLDIRDIQAAGLSVTDFFEEAGVPTHYDIQGDALFLYPKPDVSQVTAANGLKVFFQRHPSYFTASDTTKKPGFAVIFHDIPVLHACAKYAKSSSMQEKARELDAEITKRKKQMIDFFSKRNPDYKPRMVAKFRSVE